MGDGQRQPRRRLLRGILLLLSLLIVGAALALTTMDRWFFVVLDPGPFDPSLTPPAPDYDDPASWAALPETEDGADVSLPEHPSIDPSTATADVFYLHPTTWLGGEWNGPFDDPVVVEATKKGGTLIQASAFNACCAVYAPRYRQANGRAYTHPDAHGQKARDVAFADVSSAFDAFLERTADRPFIVAGHSQGAVLATRLIRERVADTELESRFVVAYLPGAPIRADEIGVPICQTPDQTACITSWHARGPHFEPNELEFEATLDDPMAGRVCVNPISWTTDDAPVPASQNAGAIFFDTPAPVVKPRFADAQCVGGSLVITEHGDLERDFMSTLLLWLMGPENYHPIEYQLFYLDIRQNAVDRVRAWAGTP